MVACAAAPHNWSGFSFLEECGSESSTAAGSVASSSQAPADSESTAAEQQEVLAIDDACVQTIWSDAEADGPPRECLLTIRDEMFGQRKTLAVTLGKIEYSTFYKVDVDSSQKLGEGKFGTVRPAQALRSSGDAAQRAVKSLRISQYSSPLRRQCLNQELLIHSEASAAQQDLSQLQPPVLTPPRHPLVVRVHDIFSDSSEISIVMERLGRTLGEHLEDACTVNVMKARRWAGELASALHFLHNKQLVAHRDVKSDNILMDRDVNPEHIRLGDFGFATVCKDSVSVCNKTFCGTPEFMAPEVLRNQGYNGQKSDMWSMGVVTLDMYGVSNPFGGDSPARDRMTIVRNVAKKNYLPTMPIAPGVGEVDLEFIQSLLARPAEQRLSAAEAVSHALFRAPAASASA